MNIISKINKDTPTNFKKGALFNILCCGVQYVDKNDSFELWRTKGRNDYQIIIIKSGRIKMIYNDDVTYAEENDIIIFMPKEVQHYIFEEGIETHTEWIHFYGETTKKILNNLKITSGIYKRAATLKIKQLSSLIIQEQAIKHNSELSVLLLINIFTEIYSASLSIPQTPEKILPAIQTMRDHINENLSTEDLVFNCNIKKSRLIELFKKHTGMTPHEYFIHMKISTAKEYLTTTELPIYEIASNVGYDNAMYFSRLFHEKTGITPNKYRANFK